MSIPARLPSPVPEASDGRPDAATANAEQQMPASRSHNSSTAGSLPATATTPWPSLCAEAKRQKLYESVVTHDVGEFESAPLGSIWRRRVSGTRELAASGEQRAFHRFSVPSRPCVSTSSSAPHTAPTLSTPLEEVCVLGAAQAQ
jgi:hypothetical protein